MLKYFEVSGFKNFKDTISIDFSDVRDYRFNKHCITDNSIGKIIIYGKNSIGKSNFGLALFDIVSHLSSKNVTPGLYDYYLNADNRKGYAEFRYIFEFGNVEMEYSYKKNQKQSIIYEKLLMDHKMIFEKDAQDGIKVDLEEFAPTLNIDMIDVESLLKYIVVNTVIADEHPIKRLFNYVNHMLWFRSLDENRYIGYKTKSDDYFDFIFENKTLNEFEVFLHKAGVEEDLVVKTDNDGRKRLYFDTAVPLPFFRVASSGTKALYTFF